MIDLSVARNGQLGPEVHFSDLFAAASLGHFTGGLLVRAPRDAAVFFRNGVPVHAGGAAFDRHFLGEILAARGLVTSGQLAEALEKQAAAEGARPLLGALLVEDAGLDPGAVKEALSQQIEARIFALFGIVEGTWQSAPGENARIREIGVLCQAQQVLARGVAEHASDEELRDASDLLLGKAVQLAATPAFELGGPALQILKYLDKPRKPDQLERAVNNRRLVRAVLRLLWLTNALKTLPAPQAIPIPKATLLKGTQLPGAPTSDVTTEVVVTAPEPGSTSDLTKKPTSSPSAASERNMGALVAEVRAIHAGLEQKSYFELLGVKKETGAADVKKAYHLLAKKFHPDAFAGGLADDVAQMVRDIAAKLNEANQVLTNEKSRAEYVALLSNDRIKGDARKAEKIRDAEVKHQMGLVMLKKRDYLKAREYFNLAVTSDPDEPEYKASMAWAMFADPKFDRDEALDQGYQLILEALKGKRPSATTHFYAGQMLKAKDQTKDALFHFKRAQALDPKNTDTAREIRLLELRQDKDKDDKPSSNPLKRLFRRS